MAAVFVIDDDVDLLDVLSETLMALCKVNKVVTATSMAKAQAQKEEILNCETAILDVNLGIEQPNGIDVASWLRTMGFKGKIVFLTGHAKTDPAIVAATKVPDTTVVAKPIGIDELCGFVKGPC